jgi:NAD(P)-dependent dehydrogenase (short-subunit alcohol dehydrogenase family)
VHRRRRRHGGRAGAGLTTVLVIGASRGIGLEFARQYAAQGATVIATARDDAGLQRLEALGARALRIDVADAASIGGLGGQLGSERLDVALYVAGVMSRGGATEAPSLGDFDRVMRTNVWGAMQAIPQISPLVEAAGGRFVFISSAMGHIAGASSSYSWVYRASKSALNMTVAAAQPDYPKAVLVAMSPGWVQTDMGGASAPLALPDSVAAMRGSIAALTPAERGAFLNYDGRRFDGW